MDNQKIYRIIEIVVTAILAIAGTLLVYACTASLTISKNNRGTKVSTEQVQTTSVDSTDVKFHYE